MNDFGRRQLLWFAASLARPALIFGSCRSPVASFGYQNGTKSARPAMVYDVPESYEIYSDALNSEDSRRKAVIRSHPAKNKKHVLIEEHLILIASETCSFDGCTGRRESEWPSLFLPAIRDYKELIKSKWLLLPNFSLDKPYDLLSLEEFTKFDRQSFVDTYPDSSGCVMLSPVGFNEQKTVAVVFIARAYPGRGAGTLCAFTKEKDGWLQSDAMSVGCGWGNR